ADKHTANEKKALKLAHDNHKAFRNKKNEEANQPKVDEAVEDLYQSDENDDVNDVLLKRVSVMEAQRTTDRFWSEHQDDKKFEPYMVKALQEEKAKFGTATEEQRRMGEQAARLLAGNLPRLLREAKYIAGDDSSDAARDAGRREERERLRKAQ